MGKEDFSVNRMLERPIIFADLVNGYYYHGRQVVDPEELVPQPTMEQIVYERNDGKRERIKRIRDIKMKAKWGTYSVTFAAETQNKVHYAMPLRNMMYDAIAYTKQVQDMEKKHLEAGDRLSSEEFLSGITKEDLIEPIVNFVLYLGDDWDGAKSLHEMMGIHENTKEIEDLIPYLPDYKLNLISPETIEDPKWFRSCLQHIFAILKLKKDKTKLFCYLEEHKEDIRKMDSVERDAMFTLFGEGKTMKELFEEMKEESDMPGIFTEMIQELAEEKAKELAEELAVELAEERVKKLAEKKAERSNILTLKLLSEKRYDDLERAVKEPDYEEQLMRKFQIV